jgi:signal transduction histidine kinase
MLTKVIKCSAIVALIAGILSRPWPDFGLALRFVVVAAAFVVLVQALTMGRYVWTALFLVVAALFNPFFPVPFSNYAFGVASTSAVLLFFFSLRQLQPKPVLSIASITGRMPGSESL